MVQNPAVSLQSLRHKKTGCAGEFYGVETCRKYPSNVSNVLCFIQYKAVRSCNTSVLRMNQTEECVTNRVFGKRIWYNNVVGKRSLGFLAGLK